jgi:hypothetical protein
MKRWQDLAQSKRRARLVRFLGAVESSPAYALKVEQSNHFEGSPQAHSAFFPVSGLKGKGR